MLSNPKKQKFCESYVLHGNGKKAAEAAGYAASRAAVTASEFLQEYEVQQELTRLREELLQNAEISRDMLVRELKGVAFSDITDYVQVSGGGVDIKSFDDLPAHKRGAVAEVSEQANDFGGSSVKIKLHPKLDAIGKLLKMAGLDGPREGDGIQAGNTLEEGNFVLKRRKRNPGNDSSIQQPST